MGQIYIVLMTRFHILCGYLYCEEEEMYIYDPSISLVSYPAPTSTIIEELGAGYETIHQPGAPNEVPSELH